MNSEVQDFTHGLTSFGVAGSQGKTLVLGGPWNSRYMQERDLGDLKSVVVREEGVKTSWNILNFSELCRDLPSIEYVDIEYGKIDDLNWVGELKKLRHLGIRCKSISNLPDENVYVDGIQTLDITGHEALLAFATPNTRSLKILGYKEQNFESLQCPGLQALELVRAPNLVSVSGLHLMPSITELKIYSAPKLVDFSVAVNSPSLNRMSLQSCKSLGSPDEASGKALTYLSLLDCGNIDSVNWIKKFPVLQSLRISGTTVKDGKVEFLKRMHSVKTLFVENKKSYDGVFPIQHFSFD